MIKNRLTLPLLPLRGLTVFPNTALHFDVGRPKSIAAVRYAMDTNKMIFLCCQKDMSVDEPIREDLANVGTIAEIRQILNLPDGNIRILVDGLHRGRITRLTDNGQFAFVNVTRLDNIPCDDDIHIQVLVRRLLHLLESFLNIYDRFTPDSITPLLSIEDPGEMADVVISNFPLKPQLKQEILDELHTDLRLERLIALISNELDILEIEKQIMDKVQSNLDDNQREYVLREKLNVIKDELGENDNIPDNDIAKYKKQISERNLPKHVTEKLDEEFSKLLKTHPNSQEYGVIQSYIETVLSLPWDRSTEDCLDLNTAKSILDRDHCGLDKVKERILEYIAVRSLSGHPKSNILCLVGPPGTGKTSVVQSLAEALGRKYTRISLGGVHNEAEIRGHRKTYIGAMPGRVIDALKQADTNNPIMLFDEIDKMSKDYSGDPASAMLEVFDPEQNKTFRDHYIELPFDLSDVLFVATANSLETIPTPLLDRMDVIEVTGYTLEEKTEIAKKHLIPKQRKLHGLKASQLKISSSVLPQIIDGYTRESGVRSLERKISEVCRKTAVLIAQDGKTSLSLNSRNLTDVLGKQLYHYDKADSKNQIGVVNGLAWTESGGDTLCIEVNVMPGSGKLELTGNLGDVMQESAKAALSFVRSCAYKFGIAQDFYKNTDIHIHVPEGAIPKDGPSAGVTMATALVSALSGRFVDRLTAMTGEITLRGRVLPIGGLKEKSLAAFRMGITTVIIPQENKPDYEELPQKLKDNIRFVFAETMSTVLKTALIPVSVSDKTSENKGFTYLEAMFAGKEQKKSVTTADNAN